jgi:hypothetical protein
MTFKKRIKIKSSGCTFVLKWLYLEICCDIEESLLGVDVAPVLTLQQLSIYDYLH